jgi:hypothetical protein
MLVGKLTGKKQFGRPSWVKYGANIKMNLNDIECDRMDWIHLALTYGPVACSCDHDIETSDSIKCGEFLYYQRDC